MILNVPYTLVVLGIPAGKRTEHAFLVQDMAPVEIVEIDVDDAPLVVRATSTTGEHSNRRKVEREYRFHDGSFWLRSDEEAPVVDSSSHWGIKGLSLDGVVPKDVEDLLRRPAALRLFPGVRAGRFGSLTLSTLEGAKDVPKKRSKVFHRKIDFDVETAQMPKGFKVSDTTREILEAARVRAKGYALIGDVPHRRVPAPFLALMEKDGMRVECHHDKEMFKGRATWSPMDLSGMVSSLSSTLDGKIEMTTDTFEIVRPDLMLDPAAEMKRLRLAAVLLERHMGERLRQGDVSFFQAFVALRDVPQEIGVDALKDTIASSWAVLHERPDLAKSLWDKGVYQTLDATFAETLRAVREGRQIHEEDLVAFDVVEAKSATIQP